MRIATTVLLKKFQTNLLTLSMPTSFTRPVWSTFRSFLEFILDRFFCKRLACSRASLNLRVHRSGRPAQEVFRIISTVNKCRSILGPVTADLPRALWQPTNSHDRLLDFLAFTLAVACKSDLLAACKVASAATEHARPCNDARPFLDLSKQIHRV